MIMALAYVDMSSVLEVQVINLLTSLSLSLLHWIANQEEEIPLKREKTSHLIGGLVVVSMVKERERDS